MPTEHTTRQTFPMNNSSSNKNGDNNRNSNNGNNSNHSSREFAQKSGFQLWGLPTRVPIFELRFWETLRPLCLDYCVCKVQLHDFEAQGCTQ